MRLLNSPNKYLSTVQGTVSDSIFHCQLQSVGPECVCVALISISELIQVQLFLFSLLLFNLQVRFHRICLLISVTTFFTNCKSHVPAFLENKSLTSNVNLGRKNQQFIYFSKPDLSSNRLDSSSLLACQLTSEKTGRYHFIV